MSRAFRTGAYFLDFFIAEQTVFSRVGVKTAEYYFRMFNAELPARLIRKADAFEFAVFFARSHASRSDTCIMRKPSAASIIAYFFVCA